MMNRAGTFFYKTDIDAVLTSKFNGSWHTRIIRGKSLDTRSNCIVSSIATMGLSRLFVVINSNFSDRTIK